MAQGSSKPLTPEDVRAKATTGELEGATLVGIKLPRAQLAGAKLKRVDAVGANLKRADLRGADLAGANLSGADLRGADLSGADLTGADLSRVEASKANFTGAKLGGVAGAAGDFSRADFKNAGLSGADLSMAVFYQSRFEDADLSRVKLPGADATAADFTGADLTASDLRHAAFRECRMERTKVVDVDGEGADFSFAAAAAVDFSRAKLAKARFSGAALYTVDFTAADLTGASFNESEHREVNFRNATLTQASMKRVRGCSLETLQQLETQGAVVGMRPLRRFGHWLANNRAAKIVIGATLAIAAVLTFHYFTDPSHWSYAMLQARAEKHLKLGHYKEGIRLYETAVRKFTDDPRRVEAGGAGFALIDLYQAQGRYKDAEAMIADMLQRTPRKEIRGDLLLRRARLCEAQGEADRAEPIYREVFDMDVSPRAHGAGLALVDIAAKNEQYAAAEKILDELEARLQGNPDEDRESQSNSRFTARERRDRLEAVQLRRIRLFQDQRKYYEAIPRLEALAPTLVGVENRYDASFLLIDLYRAVDNIAGAEKAFSRLPRGPGSDNERLMRAKIAMAQFYTIKGFVNKAEAMYNDILAESPEPGAARQAKGDLAGLYRRAGQYEKAEALYRELVNLPGDDKIIFHIGLSYGNMLTDEKKYEEADKVLRAMYDRWKADAGERTEIAIANARLLAATGRQSEAAALLERELPSIRDSAKVGAVQQMLHEMRTAAKANAPTGNAPAPTPPAAAN